MNRPTTRTEQMLASASKGVSSRLLGAEAAGFVETGEFFVAGLIKGLLRKAGYPQCVRSGHFKRDYFMYVRLSPSLRLDQSLSNPCATKNSHSSQLPKYKLLMSIVDFSPWHPLTGSRSDCRQPVS